MADGMLTLQQECEAFGETMPEPKTNHHGRRNRDDDWKKKTVSLFVVMIYRLN